MCDILFYSYIIFINGSYINDHKNIIKNPILTMLFLMLNINLGINFDF